MKSKRSRFLVTLDNHKKIFNCAMLDSKQKIILCAIMNAQINNLKSNPIDEKLFMNHSSFIKKTFKKDCQKLQSLGLINIYRGNEKICDQSNNEIMMNSNVYFEIQLEAMLEQNFITKLNS